MVTLQLKNDKWFMFTIAQFAFIDELDMIWLFNAIFNNIQLNRDGVFYGWWRKPESKEKTTNLPQIKVKENRRGIQEWTMDTDNIGQSTHRADTKNTKPHTHNTRQKDKKMINTDPIKTRTEPRCWRGVSKSCLLYRKPPCYSYSHDAFDTTISKQTQIT